MSDDYERRFADGLREAWRRVNAWIVHGELPGNGCDRTAQRNGLISACNLIAAPQDPPSKFNDTECPL